MKLYFSSGSCSLASHIVLEEAGAKYSTQRLNLREGEQRKPEYLKINPKGKVPALQLDEGAVLTENPAIISYVADTHPQANLLAKPGDLQRARAQEWLAWCASAIHPNFGPFFAALRHQSPVDPAVKTTLGNYLAQLDQWLEGKTFVLGNQFSAADAYTLVFFNWAKLFSLETGANWKRSAAALLERPAVQRVLAAHELKIAV
jgi:glutathione S-transferase